MTDRQTDRRGRDTEQPIWKQREQHCGAETIKTEKRKKPETETQRGKGIHRRGRGRGEERGKHTQVLALYRKQGRMEEEAEEPEETWEGEAQRGAGDCPGKALPKAPVTGNRKYSHSFH